MKTSKPKTNLIKMLIRLRVNGRIINLSDVLTLGPILAGHLECRQDALLDVERRRRFERTAANVDNSSIDK
jgi:hypothetical protein